MAVLEFKEVRSLRDCSRRTMSQVRSTETSAEGTEDGRREQMDRIAVWLGENAELQGKATPEALPELEREQRMLERALKATRERLLRSVF